MSLHKTCKNHSQNYQVRQRYIPTFVHQPIFDDQPLIPHLSRCTPTFHSTVLQNEGYNVKTIHHHKQKALIRPNTAVQKSVYINNTHEKRLQDLNPHFHNPSFSRDKWFDHTKEHLLETIKNCNVRGYSKQRKYADLSSDLVFTSFQYGNRDVYQYRNPVGNQYMNYTGQAVRSPQTSRINGKDIGEQNLSNLNNNENHYQNRIVPVAAPQLQDSLDNIAINNGKANHHQQKQKKDFHKNCVPKNAKQLALKGKKIKSRPQSAVKAKIVSEKPTFTVIRKNRISDHS